MRWTQTKLVTLSFLAVVLVDQIQVGQGGMDVDCPLDELSSASGLSDPGRSFPSAHLAQSIPLVNAAVVLCVIKPQPSH